VRVHVQKDAGATLDERLIVAVHDAHALLEQSADERTRTMRMEELSVKGSLPFVGGLGLQATFRRNDPQPATVNPAIELTGRLRALANLAVAMDTAVVVTIDEGQDASREEWGSFGAFGQEITRLDLPFLVAVADASATTGTVLASFSGQQIAGGHSALIAVQLKASVLRELQTLRIRRVKVTLTVSNHLTGGPDVTSTATLYLRIAPLAAGACPVATGQVIATTLGPVTLGATREHARHVLPGYTARNYHTDNFCLYHGSGIRVGYASTRLLGTIATAQQMGSKIVLALTANHYYTLDGVRPGTRLATASRKLKLGKAIRWGLNTWYVIPGASSNAVLKVRHGIIQEVGIATKSLTGTRAQQRQLLSSF
jgi:hypothetical protein